MRGLIKRLLTDETGGEVVDYALVLGLMVVACFLVMGNVGQGVAKRWRAIADLL
jgi:Flp pilus assembly pilin Flp